MTLIYPRGALMAYVSLGAEYRNCIEIIGPELFCSTERLFSPPAGYEGQITVRASNQARTVRIPPEDCFARFLEAVFDAVDSEDYHTFAEPLLADAEVLARLVKAAQEESS